MASPTVYLDQRFLLSPHYETAYDLTAGNAPTLDLAASKLKIAGTAVDLTAAEFNYLDITTLGTGAASKAVVLDSGDDYTWPATGVLTYGVLNDATDAINATAAEINGAADVSVRHVDTADVDTYVVLVADSGKTHTIPLVTGNIAITMPTAAAGLEYKFVMAGTAAEGDNWVFTATNDFVGGIVHLDTDAGSGGDEVVPLASDGSSKNTFTVINPEAGTSLNFICDGTDWLLSGFVVADTIPTFTDV